MSRFVPPGLPMILVLCAALVPAACTREENAPAAQAGGLEVRAGNVRPLSEALALARRVAEGRVIDVELESDFDIDDPDAEPVWVYEIEILTADNRVVEVEIDAITGELLEVEGAPWPADIPRVRR